MEEPLLYKGGCEFEYDYDTIFDTDDPDFAEARAARQRAKTRSVGAGMRKVLSSCRMDVDTQEIQFPLFQNIHNYRLCHNTRLQLTPTTNKMRQIELKSHTPTSHHHHHSLSPDSGLLDDLRQIHASTDSMLTLEELKSHYSSCFTCGVNWTEEHVSLDCFECGGYSMERPCPVCDGRCKRIWRRDLAMSHSMHKAHWEGECGLPSNEQQAYFVKNLVDGTEDSLTEALGDLSTSS